MQKIIIFLYLIVNSLLIEAQNISSGLLFASHTAIKEERTSLEMSPRFDASKGFTLDFDIKLRPETHNYGYVFRIIINDERSFDLIANFSPGKRSLNLVEGDNVYLAFDESKLSAYQWNKWVQVRCTITPGAVKLSFDNQNLQGNYDPLNIGNVKFCFGYSNHPGFHSSDVPPMSIRNVRITDDKGNPVAYWPLKEHSLHTCLDSIRQNPAQVSNATWEINKHTKWVKEQTLKLPAQTQICNVPTQNSIYFANSTFTLKYSLADNTLDTLKTSGSPYAEKNNQLVYNPYYNELWSYDFDSQKTISRYNFQQQAWSNNDYEIKNPEYSQHNVFISPKDSCLYIFGGYGNYQYKNKILKKNRLQDDWTTVSYQEEISPRYLSGMGFKNKDSILIFGGCGNPQGKQELGVVNYYDLYAVDINTFQAKKLWSISNNSDNFVVGNSIVTDEKNNKLYALCFPNECSNNYILLRSFDLSDGDNITSYADTIPFTFNDVNSFCTLYYDSLQSRLYAITNYNHGTESDINIYSLAYPPLELKDTLQTETEEQSYAILICLLIGVCLIVGIGYVYYYVSHRKRKASLHTVKETVSTENDHSLPETMPTINMHSSIPRTSSILFLNGFQVWDRDGKDITKSFTPILKQLLTLIILYSEKNKKGISNVTLRELLWFDKMDESAQNNRRVNIRKLKLLLEQLDGVELVKENTYWSIQFTRTYCDYIEICRFIDQLKNNLQITDQNIQNVPLGLLSGQLLPYIQADWLDRFKSDYSNAVLDMAIKLTKQEYIKNNNELLIQIANIMFAHDQTDENALILKCQALYKNGRTGLAKTTFDAFCNEYKTILNTEYKKSFNDIIDNSD